MDKKTQQDLLELVRRNYREIAAEFDRTRKKKLWPELEKLATSVPAGSKVLDAGCGNGRLASVFQSDNISYCGFDSSQELISLAKKNHPEADFSVDDVLAMDNIPDATFDYIFCIAVVPHIPGYDLRVQAINRLANKLKIGGRMIISFWDLRAQRKYRFPILISHLKKILGLSRLDGGDLLFSWQNERGSRRYYHAFSKSEINALTAASGLEKEKLYRVDNNFWLILKK